MEAGLVSLFSLDELLLCFTSLYNLLFRFILIHVELRVFNNNVEWFSSSCLDELAVRLSFRDSVLLFKITMSSSFVPHLLTVRYELEEYDSSVEYELEDKGANDEALPHESELKVSREISPRGESE